MQRYAEEAMFNHVAKYLQPLFDAERKGKANAPYAAAISMEKAQQNLKRAMQQSERYIMMHNAGATDANDRLCHQVCL